MAKQKVENKEQAILEAAVTVFAERGFWNTPTSLISKTAGVAEGTLFTYFKTKDDLISQLYLDIKREMAEEVLVGIDAQASLHDKMRHVWNGYIDWGLRHPERFKVIHQIGESYALDEAVKAAALEPFSEIPRMAAELVARGEIYDYPVEYLAALMDAHTAMTIQYIRQNPDSAIDYKTIGFDILWNGVCANGLID